VNGLTKNFLDRLYAYEIFDDEDRAVWLSPNEVKGMKYAVTLAISEQKSKDEAAVNEAYEAGEQLAKTLLLAQKVKNKLM
jgi:hypothetical protein